MPPVDDYYALLGVRAGADDEELRRAWRSLALRWHPDRAGSGATATFQQLSVAYAVLSDPISRAERRAAPGVMLSRLSGPLASLIACGAAKLDEPGFVTLVLREDEAAQGGMATISLRVELWCPDCGGQGSGCERCGGGGKVRELFSAWLAVPPGVAAGEVLAPSVELPGMVAPVRFHVRLRAAK